MQSVGSEILCRVFGREPSPFIFITAFICGMHTIHRLLTLAWMPMTLDGRTHPNQGKLLLLLFPVYCIIFVLLVVFLPLGWLDVDSDQAGRGIMHGITVAKGAWSSLSNGFQSGHEATSTDDSLAGRTAETGSWEVCVESTCCGWHPFEHVRLPASEVVHDITANACKARHPTFLSQCPFFRMPRSVNRA